MNCALTISGFPKVSAIILLRFFKKLSGRSLMLVSITQLGIFKVSSLIKAFLKRDGKCIPLAQRQAVV